MGALAKFFICFFSFKLPLYLIRRTAIMHNGGNKKRSGLEAENLSTAKHLQKVILFQFATGPALFFIAC